MSLLSSVSAFSLLGGGVIGAWSQTKAASCYYLSVMQFNLSHSHGLDFARYCVMLLPRPSNVSNH
jgi:nitric oxide reductase large subunit